MISGFSRTPCTSPSSRKPDSATDRSAAARGRLRRDLELLDREVHHRLAELCQ